MKMNPSEARYREDLGVAAFAAGRLGESEEYFRESVRLAPEDLTAWSSLAAEYIAEGKPELASGISKQVLSGVCSRIPRQMQCSLFTDPPPPK